eukprot:245201-Chlamydomonas_euryale.AAC.2
MLECGPEQQALCLQLASIICKCVGSTRQPLCQGLLTTACPAAGRPESMQRAAAFSTGGGAAVRAASSAACCTALALVTAAFAFAAAACDAALQQVTHQLFWQVEHNNKLGAHVRSCHGMQQAHVGDRQVVGTHLVQPVAEGGGGSVPGPGGAVRCCPHQAREGGNATGAEWGSLLPPRAGWSGGKRSGLRARQVAASLAGPWGLSKYGAPDRVGRPLQHRDETAAVRGKVS